MIRVSGLVLLATVFASPGMAQTATETEAVVEPVPLSDAEVAAGSTVDDVVETETETAVAALSCKETIAALFKDGPMNPFNRPSWHESTVQINKDDSETHVVDATWQNPARVRSFSNNNHIIAIGSDTWMAQSEDGPWTVTGRTLPEDIEAFHQRTSDMLMKNMTDEICPGVETFNGRDVTRFVYRSVTDPNESGNWFGGLFQPLIDLETGLLVQMEISETVSNWDPEPANFMTITRYEYDDTIKVDPPELELEESPPAE